MSRKPTDRVQISLRIPRSLRLELEAAAREKGTSTHAEMVARIANTFRQPALLDADQVLEKVNLLLGPLADNALDLARAGDIGRVVSEMVAQLRSILDRGSFDRDAAQWAIDKYAIAKRGLDFGGRDRPVVREMP